MKNHTNFFERLANLSSFVIDSGVIYTISEHDSRKSNRVEVGERRYDLNQFMSVAAMEDLEERLYQGKMFTFTQNYVQEALQAEILSERQKDSRKDILRLQEFVLLEVLPLMIDTAYDLGELLHVDLEVKKSGREVIEDVLQLNSKEGEDVEEINVFQEKERLRQKVLERITQEIREEPYIRAEGIIKEQGEKTLWDRLVQGSICVMGGEIFGLRDIDEEEKEGEIRISIENIMYGLEYNCSASDLGEKYDQLLLNTLKQSALAQWNVETDERVMIPANEKKRRGALERLADTKNFEYGNLGYIREGELFYVYWEMPKFAMQNPLEPQRYHPFPATRVSVRVNASDGRVYHEGAYVVDEMAHPFLRDWKNRYEHICILSGGNFENTAQGIVRHISSAINAFTNGLTLKSLDEHGSRDENAMYFGRSLKETYTTVGTLTREQAVEAGYRITNEWILDGKERGEEIQGEKQ